MLQMVPNSQIFRTTVAIFLVLVVCSAGGLSCKQPAPPPPAMGPAEVGVITLTTSQVSLTQDLPGRTSAFRVAEVRARVNGIVQSRLFKEGSDVQKGDVL